METTGMTEVLSISICLYTYGDGMREMRASTVSKGPKLLKGPKGFPWEPLGLRMAEVFRALGDVNRMKMIKILASNPDDSVCVVDLARMLGITQPAASQHIRVLSNVGILVPKRSGNRTFYAIDAERLHEHKATIDHMFKMAFVRCTHDGDCDNCRLRGRCR